MAITPQVRLQDVRHTAETLLLSKAVHAKRVSEMHGNSTITLTLGTNSHLIPTVRGDAAAEMDAVLTA